jgi:O-antigen/teichoic acid export membrane protein
MTETSPKASAPRWRNWPRATLQRLLDGPGTFTSHAFISMGGTAASRLIMLAALPLTTRLYEPADLGASAIILTFSGFLVPLATLRFDLAVVLAASQRTAAALMLSMVLGILALVIAIGAAAIIGGGPLLARLTGLTADNSSLLVFVPVAFVLLGLQAVFHAWLTRERKFATLSTVQFVQAIATVIATLTLPFMLGASGATATLAATLGLALAVALAARTAAPEAWLAIGKGKLGQAMWQGVRRYRVYPKYILPYTLSSGLAERILQAVIATVYSLSALGAFYTARQLMLAPAMLIDTTLRPALFAHSARNADMPATRRRIAKLFGVVAGLQLPLLVYCLFWMKPVLLFLVGPKWTVLADFAWWYIIPGTTMALLSWLVRMFDVLGRQKLQVGLRLAAEGTTTAVTLAAPFLGWPIQTFVASLALTIAMTHLIELFVLLGVIGFTVVEIRTLLLPPVMIGLVSAAAHGVLSLLVSTTSGVVLGTAILAATAGAVGYRYHREQRT